MSPSALALASVPEDLAPQRLHRLLLEAHQRRLRPRFDPESSEERAADALAQPLEDQFVADELAAVQPLLRDVPPGSNPDAFVSWFERLRASGPGQHDHLFPWLAKRASMAEMRWFLGQEVAGEAGFEDLLALTQVRMPRAAKLEMGRNFWDELGRGHPSGMHGPMLERLSLALDLQLPLDEIIWPALALSNLMVAMASHRRYAYQSVGALGVIELTAPDRAAHVNQGLRRLGVAPGDRKYFALHATLDIQHSAAWNQEVLRCLLAEEPRCARAIAEGALVRLRAGARCFEWYRHRLGVPAPA